MDDLDGANWTEQMPAPPPFWKHFTEENIAKAEEAQKDGMPVSQDLRALVPPDPPADGKYRTFNISLNVSEYCEYGRFTR